MEVLNSFLRDLKEKSDALRTSAVTLISHAHGRERRAERGILRRELQAAIKYGEKVAANPGRRGTHECNGLCRRLGLNPEPPYHDN